MLQGKVRIIDQVEAILISPRLRSLVYSLITTESDYAEFSNTGYATGRNGSYNSLENVHNYIHAYVGNGGHMVRFLI